MSRSIRLLRWHLLSLFSPALHSARLTFVLGLRHAFQSPLPSALQGVKDFLIFLFCCGSNAVGNIDVRHGNRRGQNASHVAESDHHSLQRARGHIDIWKARRHSRMEVIKMDADFLVGRLGPVRFPFDKSYETADARSEGAKVYIRCRCSW
jgi:hypothetical protein